MKPPKPPPPRAATARTALREALVAARAAGAWATARELAEAARISEKDVAEHLGHLARTLAREGNGLEVEPAECLACGYVFRDRAKLTTPGACPACRSERVQPPAFRARDAGQ